MVCAPASMSPSFVVIARRYIDFGMSISVDAVTQYDIIKSDTGDDGLRHGHSSSMTVAKRSV